jgi:hypothetical protein
MIPSLRVWIDPPGGVDYDPLPESTFMGQEMESRRQMKGQKESLSGKRIETGTPSFKGRPTARQKMIKILLIVVLLVVLVGVIRVVRYTKQSLPPSTALLPVPSGVLEGAQEKQPGK